MPHIHGGMPSSSCPWRTIGPDNACAPSLRRPPIQVGSVASRGTARTVSGVRAPVPFGDDAISDILEGTRS